MVAEQTGSDWNDMLSVTYGELSFFVHLTIATICGVISQSSDRSSSRDHILSCMSLCPFLISPTGWCPPVTSWFINPMKTSSLYLP